MTQIKLILLLVFFGLNNIYSQICLDDFKYYETDFLDNKKKKRQIPKYDRIPEIDTICISFMEGFNDSIVVFLNGEFVYTGIGKESISTGFVGLNYLAPKEELIGGVLEIFLINKKMRTSICLLDNDAKIIMLRQFGSGKNVRWVCDIRNYIIRLK